MKIEEAATTGGDTTPGRQPGGSPVSLAATRLYTRTFVLLWLGALAFYASYRLFLTAMPIFAQGLGANELQIGLLGGMFAGASMVVRLPVGWYLDRGRRVPALMVGAAIFALSAAGYALIEPVASMLLVAPVALLLGIRVFHGFGMATFTTAGQTLIVSLTPATRRGEGLGIYGMANNIAAGLCPAAGMAIALAFSFPSLFVTCAIVAALAILLCGLVVEPARGTVRRPAALIFNPAVLAPSVVALTLMVTYGAVMYFLPVYAVRRGMENPGLFFIVYMMATLAAQALAGRASDRFGRLAATVPGMLLAAAAPVAIAAAEGWGFLAAAVVYGLGMGIAQPVLVAWAGDLVRPEQRGSAMATIGVFQEAGITSGSVVAGLIAGPLGGLGATFVAIGVIPLLGLAVAVARGRAPASVGKPVLYR